MTLTLKTGWLVALCFPLTCTAGVFKCEKDGQTAFTDKPCAEGKSIALAAAPGGAVGALTFDILEKTYPVHGSRYTDAFAAMKAMGTYNAWARWKVVYNFQPKQAGNGCEVSALSIHVAGEILMPEWVEQRSAPVLDQRYWQQSWDVLKLHENGHIQNGREFGVLLREKLLGLGVASCDVLRAKADGAYRVLYENLRRRDEEYDRRSNHGLRQFNQQ